MRRNVRQPDRRAAFAFFWLEFGFVMAFGDPVAVGLAARLGPDPW